MKRLGIVVVAVVMAWFVAWRVEAGDGEPGAGRLDQLEARLDRAIGAIAALDARVAALEARAGARPAPAPGAQPPAAADPFLGTWVEYWPGIDEHATHTITRLGDAYQIAGSSPLTPAYKIRRVTLDGDCLKFLEDTAKFTVTYELRVKDARTLAVRALGMSGWRDLVWRRAP